MSNKYKYQINRLSAYLKKNYETKVEGSSYVSDSVVVLIESLQSRLDAKSADLVMFGRHLPECNRMIMGATKKFLENYTTKCTCGFDAAKEKP